MSPAVWASQNPLHGQACNLAQAPASRANHTELRRRRPGVWYDSTGRARLRRDDRGPGSLDFRCEPGGLTVATAKSRPSMAASPLQRATRIASSRQWEITTASSKGTRRSDRARNTSTRAPTCSTGSPPTTSWVQTHQPGFFSCVSGVVVPPTLPSSHSTRFGSTGTPHDSATGAVGARPWRSSCEVGRTGISPRVGTNATPVRRQSRARHRRRRTTGAPRAR